MRGNVCRFILLAINQHIEKNIEIKFLGTLNFTKISGFVTWYIVKVNQ